jgi:hypothetical protein
VRRDSLQLNTKIRTDGNIIQPALPCAIQERIKEAKHRFVGSDKSIIDECDEASEDWAGTASAPDTGDL